MPAPHLVAAPAAPAPLPSSTAAIGSAAARALLAASGARDLALWGSSSMSSERGDESTPLPIRIHEHLALTVAPGTVHAHGVGATWSQHAVLMRGLDTPQATPQGSPDAVTVTLDPDLPPHGRIRFPASLGDVPGQIDGSSGTWIFTPSDASATVTAGRLVSALAERTAGARQVLWMGKNNIHQVERVLEDTQRMWDAAADPEHDTLVLGQWATPSDPVGSATAEAVAQVSAEQQRRYGDHFLDLGELLTSESGLSCPPLAPLRLLEQATTHAALEQGIVPADLRAPDDIHLNGWGNLAVSWAIVRRLRELRWL